MQGSILTPEFSDFLLDNGLRDAYFFMELVPIAFGLLGMPLGYLSIRDNLDNFFSVVGFGVLSFLVALVSLVFCVKRLKHSSSKQRELSSSHHTPQNLADRIQLDAQVSTTIKTEPRSWDHTLTTVQGDSSE